MLTLLLVSLALAHARVVPAQPTPDWSTWPAQGTVTSPFGHDGGRWHPGIDIGILRSTVVRAAEAGRVTAVGTPRGFEGYGNLVQVSLGAGWFALYAHLAGWRVRVGEWVSAGQRLGTAGCTGWCTGTHLHFEVRRHLMSHALSPLTTVLKPLLTPRARPHAARMLVSARPKPNP